MRIPLAVLPLAALAVLALAAPAGAATGPGASAAATTRCNLFRVVHSDTAIGFPQGTYQRLNFFSRASQMTCSFSIHVLQEYLEDGVVPNFTVSRLTGSLADSAGCRFVKRGTGGKVGFTVWCDGEAGTRGACVAAGNRYASNCGSSY